MISNSPLKDKSLTPTERLAAQIAAIKARKAGLEMTQKPEQVSTECAEVSVTIPSIEIPTRSIDAKAVTTETLESKLAAIKASIAAKKAIQAEVSKAINAEFTPLSIAPIDTSENQNQNQEYTPPPISTDMLHKGLINLNEQQLAFRDACIAGHSVTMIGAAGTGKTTSVHAGLAAILQHRAIPMISRDHKYLSTGIPGIAILAFTRRATQNIQRSLPDDLKGNCITIHKFLEYSPVFIEATDDEGNTYNKRVFQATRNQFNPIPTDIQIIVIEEASMVSIELFQEIQLACAHKVQFIFLGDIQQLPPVFGSAILGFAMLQTKLIELTHVYRQALDSPIIRLAHRVLSGISIPASQFDQFNEAGKLRLHPWKKALSAQAALYTAAYFLTHSMYDSTLPELERYNPDRDAILIPFNKAFGTIELNKHIANHIARHNNRVTFEVIAGFMKYYYSVGDKVMLDKEDGIITDIVRNPAYVGAATLPASETLDYWGIEKGSIATKGGDNTGAAMSDSEIDDMLEAMMQESEDRVTEASHIISVLMVDTQETVQIKTASSLNNTVLSYAMTVHKSQGSEFQKVYLLLHSSHATMVSRELLYTAITRAKEYLYVICEPDQLAKGIQYQRIKGNTIAEKAELFKGKQKQLAGESRIIIDRRIGEQF